MAWQHEGCWLEGRGCAACGWAPGSLEEGLEKRAGDRRLDPPRVLPYLRRGLPLVLAAAIGALGAHLGAPIEGGVLVIGLLLGPLLIFLHA
jgi:hypothetical protein